MEGYPEFAFLRAVLDRCLEAVEKHQLKLREAFTVFDDEGNGLEFEEFQHLVAACSTESMDEETIVTAYEKVGHMYSRGVDGAGMDGDHERDEDDDPGTPLAVSVSSVSSWFVRRPYAPNFLRIHTPPFPTPRRVQCGGHAAQPARLFS